MIETPLQKCIKAAHRAGLENAEQLSEQSVILRFPSLCAWYREACRERDELSRVLQQALEEYKESGAISNETWENAEWAIAKAKGETP